MKLGRRCLCRHGLASVALLGLGPLGCRRGLGRGEVLAAIVRETALTDTRNLVDANVRLEAALTRFEREPSLATLRTARETWRGALLAWKRCQCFRFGPLLETKALLRAAYWPTRPALLDGALAGTATIDDRFVSELGADSKGIFALEYLLFPLDIGEAEVVARFSGEPGHRRRRLTAALGRSVQNHAKLVGTAFADGNAFSRRFAENSGENLNLLVGDLIASLESLAVQRLSIPLELAANGLLKPANIEGWPSGTSQELALTILLGSQSIFRGKGGGGLLDLARGSAPAVAERVEERLENAIAKVRAVGMPLERAARENRVALGTAASAARALEVVLKVELTSALGVTLTFTAADGD